MILVSKFLWAAKTFSLIPPTGKTLPVKVISPVMANYLSTIYPVNKLINAVKMVIPAEGPSFGTEAIGKWICKSIPGNPSGTFIFI